MAGERDVHAAGPDGHGLSDEERVEVYREMKRRYCDRCGAAQIPVGRSTCVCELPETKEAAEAVRVAYVEGRRDALEAAAALARLEGDCCTDGGEACVGYAIERAILALRDQP